MFEIKPSGDIVLPQGDTLLMSIRIKNPRFPKGTAGIFGITSIPMLGRGREVYKKIVLFRPVVNSPNILRAIIYISNSDSKKIAVGDYLWDFRIVTIPELDEDGTILNVADSDHVMSIFSGRPTGMPSLRITEVAANV